ncbi:MAG: hypothetical protein COS92_07795 [Desulfobacterales bacterium CG07_land_8_20_14_0_80_52_14]|nr:MAG: hypothetical protein COS92_07795 [Desulfobacterales bacterium CG07_land_8_20_14_0_80_52_14]
MKIAMLAPIDRKISPRSRGERERVVSRLTEGLVAKGIAVDLFATADSETRAALISVCPAPPEKVRKQIHGLWECLHISSLFERANEYDLIHNHFGDLPMTFSGLIETPMLTTLYAPPTDETLPIYRKHNGKIFYVSSTDTDRSAELTYVASIEHTSESIVEDYIRVYRDVLKKTAREDHRPWGFYEVLSDREDHKVKRITVYPGKRLSYQRHRRRSEHWHVVAGEAVVTLNGREVPRTAGESIDIPCGAAHRISNLGNRNVVFIEVQKGDYFGEDDIERLEDDFGRN